MKRKLWFGVAVWTGALLPLLLWIGVTAQGPGDVNGVVANDPQWHATPGWSAIYEHSDKDQDPWGTGISFWDLYYSAGGNDPFDYYVHEMTIPWVGIKMSQGEMVYYGHSEDTSDNHLKYVSHTFTERPNQQTTTLTVDYDLDFDSDSIVEWSFTEKIDLCLPGGQYPGGYLTIEFPITQFPTLQNGKWGHNGDTVETIEIPFLFDAYVYSDPNNNFYFWNGNQWVLVSFETFFRGVGWGQRDLTKIENPNPPMPPPVEERSIILRAIPQQHGFPTFQDIYFVHCQYTEYSQHPSEYLNDESIELNNGALWYIETYDVQNNPPPNGGQWTGVACYNFEA